jgi:hypothetical protein
MQGRSIAGHLRRGWRVKQLRRCLISPESPHYATFHLGIYSRHFALAEERALTGLPIEF